MGDGIDVLSIAAVTLEDNLKKSAILFHFCALAVHILSCATATVQIPQSALALCIHARTHRPQVGDSGRKISK